MSSSFEKSVKGGTKIKLAPPKAKYVEHILLATHSGEAGVAEVFRTLQNRLRDSTWTIVFKSLIIVHLMIKEGQRDVTLKYLAGAPQTRLAINSFTDAQTQGQNIRRYSNYLLQRAVSFADIRYDYTQPGALDRMKSVTVDKGLLRETRSIQDQIKTLLKCDFFSQDQENEIGLMAFRLLTKDLLDLYAAMNQAVMNVLSCYFELSRPDAERAISLYKTFTKQTDQVVQFLAIARSYEHVTRLEIPKIKHAPTSLTKSLEEYLTDTDFDVNRRQYLAAQQGRKGTRFEGKSFNTADGPTKPAAKSEPTSSRPTATKQPEPEKAATKGPAPDLIDFFDSIEQNQTPMMHQPNQQYQQPAVTGYQPGFDQQIPQQTNGFQQQPLQQNNPFGQFAHPQQPQQQQPLNTQFTGMGFGGYGPQPQQQFVQSNDLQSQPQQQSMQQQPMHPQSMQPQFTSAQSPSDTNPFRQSMMVTGQVPFQQTGTQSQQPPMQQQSTNPFARSNPTGAQPNSGQGAGFGQSQTQQFSQPQLVPQQTGTNPFAKQSTPISPSSQQTAPQALQPMVTGSTNPFRQSQFVNQQTGRGWQTEQQGTIGGWEQMQTTPVFPRPGQQ